MNYDKQPYRRITYKVNNRVVIDELLNELHNMQLDFIDEAVEKSNLSDAQTVIDYIKGKL